MNAFTLTLTDAGKPNDPPAARRMAQALKLLLRGFSFRCVEIRDAEVCARGAGESAKPAPPAEHAHGCEDGDDCPMCKGVRHA